MDFTLVSIPIRIYYIQCDIVSMVLDHFHIA